MTKLNVSSLALIISMLISGSAYAVDLRLMGQAMGNAQGGYDAYQRGQQAADERFAREIALRQAMMDLATKEAQFRRIQQAQMEYASQERVAPTKMSCEVDCQNMYQSGELNATETASSCIANLCK
jgi:hypothetical protein